MGNIWNVGDRVEWTCFVVGNPTEQGEITRIEDGRIYIAMELTNTRGRRRTRIGEVWFDPGEVVRLRKAAP